VEYTLTIYVVVVFEKSLGHIVPVLLKGNINGSERVLRPIKAQYMQRANAT